MIKTIIFRKNAINKQLTQRKKERTSVKYTYIYTKCGGGTSLKPFSTKLKFFMSLD